MPHDELIEQRTINKKDVDDHLKQANSFKELPELAEYDAFVDSLWSECKYREYIVNYLMRHYYVRNQDLMFDIVDTKTETLADRCKNYLWVNKSKKCMTYIRNLYTIAHEPRCNEFISIVLSGNIYIPYSNTPIHLYYYKKYYIYRLRI